MNNLITPKRGRPKSEPKTIPVLMYLEPEVAKWAMTQPHGRSRFVRHLLREAYDIDTAKRAC